MEENDNQLSFFSKEIQADDLTGADAIGKAITVSRINPIQMFNPANGEMVSVPIPTHGNPYVGVPMKVVSVCWPFIVVLIEGMKKIVLDGRQYVFSVVSPEYAYAANPLLFPLKGTNPPMDNQAIFNSDTNPNSLQDFFIKMIGADPDSNKKKNPPIHPKDESEGKKPEKKKPRKKKEDPYMDDF